MSKSIGKPALTASILAGGVAFLAAWMTFIPASQAEPGWRTNPAPQLVQPYFDRTFGLLRLYVDGQEVAIVNGAGVFETHANGR